MQLAKTVQGTPTLIMDLVVPVDALVILIRTCHPRHVRWGLTDIDVNHLELDVFLDRHDIRLLYL
jgi:hypothetical protein